MNEKLRRIAARILLGKRCEKCKGYPAQCRCHLPVMVIRNGPILGRRYDDH